MIDTDKLIDKIPFNFDCPKCGNKIKKTAGWLKKNKSVTCGKCSAVILPDDKPIVRARRDVAKASAEVAEAIKQLGRLGK